ncbi:MAG: hypothetical protein RR704_07230 [Stenotrophomonas sp.]
MIKRIIAVTTLTLGLAAGAQAADFSCHAKIGPASAAQNSSSIMGSVSAANQQAAELEYFKRTSAIKTISSGRWMIHELYCLPRS